MGKKDKKAAHYLEDKERLADLLNVGLLHGQRLIRPEELRECINDYPLHIIEAARFEELELFETDLKLVFGCLRYQSRPEAFKEFLEAHREEFRKLESDAYDMIASYGHAKQLKQVKEVLVTTKSEEEGVDMCKAIDELERRAWEKGRTEGRTEGREEGREEGRLLGEKRGIEMFIRDNLEEGRTRQRIVEKLVRCFRISEDQANAFYLEFVN